MSEQMQRFPVKANWWVKIQYTLRDSQGELLEPENQTVRYLQGGYGTMFPKLEAALEGKVVGDSVSLYLEPADHFGEYDPQLVHVHPIDDFDDPPGLDDWVQGRPGMPDDGIHYRVLHRTEDTVVLDGNHPLSEIALRYDITILDVSPATKEEIDVQQAASAVEADDEL